MDDQIYSKCTSTIPDIADGKMNQMNGVVYPLILMGEKNLTDTNSDSSNNVCRC